MILIFIQTVIVTVNMDMFVQTCLGEQESEQMVSPFYKFCSNHFRIESFTVLRNEQDVSVL